jgi:hypothetical protein
MKKTDLIKLLERIADAVEQRVNSPAASANIYCELEAAIEEIKIASQDDFDEASYLADILISLERK